MWQTILLAATVAGVLVGHRHVRPAGVVLAGVIVGLASGIVEVGVAGEAVRGLAAPLAFLIAAVPMAVVLARIGFFDAVAARIAVGHRLRPTLWVFAALVTTVFNLDASIVLLTPLYLRIARLHGLDPLATAFQPVLLAALASSALPVSNLTNLIVAEHLDVSVVDFIVRLGPASAIACLVGWWRPPWSLADLRSLAAGVVLADTVNNLPALLIGLPHLDEASVWPFLAGINLGPVLWLTGSLAGLLWLDIVRRSGLQVSYGQYAIVGLRIGGPALLAAAAVVVLTGAAL